MKDSLFYRQAELLLRVLPYFRAEKDLALKGGTAINFFFRNLPRLSVDIDLCYLPALGREESFKNISEAIGRVIKEIRLHYPDSQISPRINHRDGVQYGFNIQLNGVSIKVETNYVFRGAVNLVKERELCPDGQSLFNVATSVQTLSRNDLYGGKICAALDRQHPRDLFDVKKLFDNKEYDGDIRSSFIVYLISSPRPIVELLDPDLKDISDLYKQEFQGMIREEVTLKELVDTREQLTTLIKSTLTTGEREFLLSFKKGQPNWSLLKYDHIKNLPSVRWKLMNIEAMSQDKHLAAVDKLAKCLYT